MNEQRKEKLLAIKKQIEDMIDASDGTAGDGLHVDKLAERIVPDVVEQQARDNPAIVVLISLGIGVVIGAFLMMSFGKWLVC